MAAGAPAARADDHPGPLRAARVAGRRDWLGRVLGAVDAGLAPTPSRATRRVRRRRVRRARRAVAGRSERVGGALDSGDAADRGAAPAGASGGPPQHDAPGTRPRRALRRRGGRRDLRPGARRGGAPALCVVAARIRGAALRHRCRPRPARPARAPAPGCHLKDRLLTLLLAFGAFIAFYGFFIGPNEESAEHSSRPISTETRGNGYFALRHWLESQGLPVTELRHRYDWLAGAPGLPAQGNLLITTIPHERPMRRSEESALVTWVRQGNSVLVLAGVFDTPEWGVPDVSTPGELHTLTGLWIQTHEEPEAEASPGIHERLAEPRRGALKPVG
ncbi:MAG: DUF4350 domain-containing protein, partial [Betaproteobacteria bacterium]